MLHVGWLDGMVVIGHRSSKSTSGAKNDNNTNDYDGDFMININSSENNNDIVQPAQRVKHHHDQPHNTHAHHRNFISNIITLILIINVQALTCWPGRCSSRSSSTLTSVVPQSHQSLFVTQL